MFFESRFASEIYQGIGIKGTVVSGPEMVVMLTAELLSWLITKPSETGSGPTTAD